MFHTLDSALTDYISTTYHRLQKHDIRLDMVEEKAEILVTWSNEMRLNVGSLPFDFGRYSSKQLHQQGERKAPSMSFGHSHVHPIQDLDRVSIGATTTEYPQQAPKTYMVHSSYTMDLAHNEHSWSTTPKNPTLFKSYYSS